MSSDSAFSAELEHTRTLSPRAYAYLQCATLYTSVSGERRVRVINLALNVVELAGSVFQYADLDTVVAHFAKEGALCSNAVLLLFTQQLYFVAMAGMSQTRSLIIREELTEKCAALLMAYRVQCAAATRLTQVRCGISSKMIVDFDFFSQLIIPEAFRALPAFILGLQKTKPLKGNHFHKWRRLSGQVNGNIYPARQVASDVRNYHIHRILNMGACTLMHYLYPRLLALHDLDDTAALPQVAENEDGSTSIKTLMPSCMRNGYYFMEGGGIYLMGRLFFS